MRSTVGDYLSLLEIPEGESCRAAWVDRYEAAHPGGLGGPFSGGISETCGP